jgi:hypothetical protein
LIHEDILESVLNDLKQQPNLAVSLSSYPRNSAAPDYRTLNIKAAVIDEFRSIVDEHCLAIETQLRAGDLELRPFDMAVPHLADHEIEWLEFAHHPHMLAHTASVFGSVHSPPFANEAEFLRYLHSYAVMLETPDDPVFFYRKYNPQRELARSRKLSIFYADGQYDKVRDTTFVLDRKIDCFSRGNHIYISSKLGFQAIFRWYEVLEESAQKSLDLIHSVVPIEHFDEFAVRCRSDMDKLVKLNSIANRPYLATVTMADIKKVIQHFGLSGIQIVGHGNQERIVYDASNPWAILKILDDDYLESDMTHRKYESTTKRDVP